MTIKTEQANNKKKLQKSTWKNKQKLCVHTKPT